MKFETYLEDSKKIIVERLEELSQYKDKEEEFSEKASDTFSTFMSIAEILIKASIPIVGKENMVTIMDRLKDNIQK